MISRFILFLWILIHSTSLFATEISGLISDNEGMPLPFASVYLKGTTIGTTSNENGNYVLNLDPGNYELIYQYVGFKQLTKSVVVGNSNMVLDVMLAPEEISLTQIVVSADAEDPAYRVIREAIKKRKFYKDQVEGFTCDVYIKGNQKILDAPEKILGQEIGDFGGSLDSNRQGIVYLSESVSKLHYRRPNDYKEVMISSKVSGDDNGFSFNQARVMNFSFYDSKVDIGRPNVSPIANNAMMMYKYRMEGTFYDDEGRLVNKIEVIPKRELDPVFRGYIYIIEDLWNIHSTELYLTKDATKIPVLDTLYIKQVHVPAGDSAWLPISQTITFNAAVLKFKFEGYFTGIFKNYILNPAFEKGFFGNEVFTVKEESNEKDLQYWDTIRPIPLTKEENIDYTKKDSLQIVWKSKTYLDSVDHKNNKFKPLSLIAGYSFSRSYKKKYLEFAPLLGTIRFNAVQGYNVSLDVSYRKEYDDIGAKWFEVNPSLQFGFSDKKVRGNIIGTYNFDRTKFTRLSVRGGWEAKQFHEGAIGPMVNGLYAMIAKKHYMKLYDKIYGEVNFRQEITNGIYFKGSIEYADRRPLLNTTNYSFNKKKEMVDYPANDPLDPTNYSPSFVQNQALKFQMSWRFRIKQEYIKYPDRKFIIGSKWPDLTIHYTAGLPILGSDVNYHQLRLSVYERIEMGLFGSSRIAGEVGMFLSKKAIEFMDYKHFNGNQTILADGNKYLRTFQLLPYYQYSTNKPYVEGHYMHHFNGFIWNKIPLLKKLGFTTVAGAHVQYAKGEKPYVEWSFGIDNIGWKLFRFIRVDFVNGYRPGIGWDAGFVVGFKLPGN